MLVMELHGKNPRVSKSRPSSRMVIPDGRIGLEFEWENVGRFDWTTPQGIALAPYFTIHQDGSLRDNGQEFVLRDPLFGEDLLRAIGAMDEAARAGKFKGSYRTSMHVHLDMERASYPDHILGLAITYAIAEPFMYKFVGNNRDLCNYCLPWFRHDQHFTVFLRGLSDSKSHTGEQITHRFRTLKEYKYSGLNFFSLGDYGTLEFRHAPVGMAAEKVIEWVNLIQSLKSYSTRPGRNFEGIISSAFSKTYVQFLNEVFGEHARSLLRFCPRPEEAYRLGLKTASSFATQAALLGFK